jgi:hypothetical protein
MIFEIASGIVLGWLAICALKWLAAFAKRHWLGVQVGMLISFLLVILTWFYTS